MAGDTNTTGVRRWLQIIAVGRRPRRTLVRLGAILTVAAIAYVVMRFVFIPVHIQGPSMLPTYTDGSINFINCLAYRSHEPQRGDVVGVKFSTASVQSDVLLLKRIVGLPGESISFAHGRLYVNGQPLNEPYLKYPSTDWRSAPKVLGPDEYYVVGDNRSMPFDYHEKGAAERRRIVGKIMFGGNS